MTDPIDRTSNAVAQMRFNRGDEVEITRSDDERGRAIFGDAWEQFRATLPDDGVYGITLAWDVVPSEPMTKTIRPTMANERGDKGCFTVRVEGEDVEALRSALETGSHVALDAPEGTFRVTGCSVVGDAGFFDVEAVDAPKRIGGPIVPGTVPGEPDPDREVTDPAKRRAPRSRDSTR